MKILMYSTMSIIWILQENCKMMYNRCSLNYKKRFNKTIKMAFVFLYETNAIKQVQFLLRKLYLLNVNQQFYILYAITF